MYLNQMGSENVQIPLEKYNFINKNIHENGSIFLGIRPEHVYYEKVNEHVLYKVEI